MKKMVMFTMGLLVLAGMLFVYQVRAEEKKQSEIQLKESPAHTVLYTIYRGHYSGVGGPIQKLFALAGEKEIQPEGALYFVYLNNPTLVNPEHWLTEIRMIVSDEALQQEGKLGELTDVKRIPSLQLAAISKPAGLEDPGSVYAKLFAWLAKEHYVKVENFMESFENVISENYSEMETTIMVPVEKAQSE